MSCALYAKENGLLDTPGWKQFKRIAKREKVLTRMLNQAKLKSFRMAPTYKYGFLRPNTVEQALEIDKKNGNTKWRDSMRLERDQLDEYEAWQDKGPDYDPGKDYKRINVHFVFDIKHDGRHKSRLVAGGHMTDVPLDSVYSGVVSLRSLRIVIFLSELNDLELWGTDIGNAYLEAYTKEKVYFKAGPGFGEDEGHIMIIVKALYGLRSSGLRWHEKFADTLRQEGFFPSKADGDVWMRRNGEVYEYIAVYVDDLCLAMKDPKGFIDILKDKYDYKLKGTGPINFHLGCNFHRDDEGVLMMEPKKYIGKMLDGYKNMFGEEPRNNRKTPLDKNDHPELDESPLLEQEDIKKYQSMIGALQWLISLGRVDVATAVMTMSRFRVAPRVGHLERLKRIYGYVKFRKDGGIRVRTAEPDYSELEETNYNWCESVYGRVEEDIPLDCPEPLGKPVVTTTYVDANLYHDMLTGKSVTGILHLINGTLTDWHTKRQGTVETATYGSEFVAARTATEQILDMPYTLQYFGVPVKGKAFMFGDNRSVVDSATVPTSGLNKRHTMLSYHRVREAIAAGVMRFEWIDGKINPADIVSKHCGFTDFWPHVQAMLFWKGDTRDAPGIKDEE